MTGEGYEDVIVDASLAGPSAGANLNAREDHLDLPGVVLHTEREWENNSQVSISQQGRLFEDRPIQFENEIMMFEAKIRK